MPLSGNTIGEVQTGGSDTLNGGFFDPSQTAGMFTDGAATLANTSAPVFTSASYSFVAGDVGAWLYVASGTNWTKGWFLIASVSGGAATLNATAGQSVLAFTLGTGAINNGTGCASVASPTAATWSIDYSQQASAQITYSDLASSGAGLTVSSAAHPFAKQLVGNGIVITGGTNFNEAAILATVGAGGTGYVVGDTLTLSGGTNTVAATFKVASVSGGVVTGVYVAAAGTYTVIPANPVTTTGGTGTGATLNVSWGIRYVVASVAAGVATLVGPANSSSGVASGGTGGLGGCLASPGQAYASVVAGNPVFLKAGTYSITNTTNNISGGCISPPASGSTTSVQGLYGYSAVRFDGGVMATRPLIQASGISTATLVTGNQGLRLENVNFDGQSLTSIRGANIAAYSTVQWCKGLNFTNSAFLSTVGAAITWSEASNCTLAGAISGFSAVTYCKVSGGGFGGFVPSSGTVYSYCHATGITGGYGFGSTGTGEFFFYCVSHGNAIGYTGSINSGGRPTVYMYCAATGNTTVAFTSASSGQEPIWLYNCFVDGSNGAISSNIAANRIVNMTVLSSSPWNNAAAGDFSLNSTAGAGALMRGLTNVLAGGLTTSYADAGTAQHPDPAGGGPIGRATVIQASGNY